MNKPTPQAGAAFRELAGEPLVNVIVGEPVEDAVAAALDALADRYNAAEVSRGVRAYQARGRVGRPGRAGLEARERRLLEMFDFLELGARGFAREHYKLMDSASPEAAERQLHRLLAARRRLAARSGV